MEISFLNRKGYKSMKKLTEKAEVYAALRESGKPIRTAFQMAGFKGDVKGTAPYQLERRVRTFSLVQPDMLEKGHSVAKLTLKIAEKVLKDKEKQKLSPKEEICLKKAHDIYLEQQKRETPVINRNINLNVDTNNMHDLVDLSAYRDLGGEDSKEQVINAEFTEEKPEEN